MTEPPPVAGPPAAGRLKIALVGPTHPYKGGVAAHTTQAAHHLAAAGHEVDLVSWSRLYPDRLYPGEQGVPDGEPDGPPFDRTARPLRWDRPGSWLQTGSRLRGYDLVVIVVVVPAQVPALLALVRAARGMTPGGRREAPRIVVLAHNVVPHETHPGGRALMTRMLRRADAVLVHSAEQARLAAEHGASEVATVPLPPHLPGGDVRIPRAAEIGAAIPRLRVLALGMVRRYKGFDLLLEAARAVPGVHVTIAGEQWGQAGERVRELAAEPGLAGRVELIGSYVPASRIPVLLAEHDLLALPYRNATASQNVLLAHAHGVPVLASSVGTFTTDVRDGVDGILVPPGDGEALQAALRRLCEPGVLAGLARAVPEVDLDTPWRVYVNVLTSLIRRPEFA